MEKIMADEVALSIFAEICDTFDSDVTDESSRKLFIEAIAQGRLELNQSSCEIKYKLLKPVEMGSSVLNELTFHEPTAADAEYINKDFKFTQKDGEIIIDMSAMYGKTIRMVTKLSGCMLAQANKITRRDMPYLMAITSFFD